MTKSLDLIVGEVFSEKQFCKGYKKEFRMQLSKNFLLVQGFYPFILSNSRIYYLTALGLLSTIKGQLGIDKNGRYLGNITEKAINSTNLEKLRDELGISLTPDVFGYTFGVNGTTMARVLKNMDFNFIDSQNTPFYDNLENARRSKARTGLKFPNYINKLVDNYESINASDLCLTDKYLKLLVNLFFYCKIRNKENRGNRLDMLEQPNEDLSIFHGKRLIKTINLAYPKVNLDVSSLSAKQGYRMTSNSYITFSNKQFEVLEENMVPVNQSLKDSFKLVF